MVRFKTVYFKTQFSVGNQNYEHQTRDHILVCNREFLNTNVIKIYNINDTIFFRHSLWFVCPMEMTPTVDQLNNILLIVTFRGGRFAITYLSPLDIMACTFNTKVSQVLIF